FASRPGVGDWFGGAGPATGTGAGSGDCAEVGAIWCTPGDVGRTGAEPGCPGCDAWESGSAIGIPLRGWGGADAGCDDAAAADCVGTAGRGRGDIGADA